MKCQEAKELMSNFLEESLDTSVLGRFTNHLSGCVECRRELEELRLTLQVIRWLPSHEPVTNLWSEFVPKFAEYNHSKQSGIIGYARSCLLRVLYAICEGWLIFISVVSYNTNRKFRYLTGSAD